VNIRLLLCRHSIASMIECVALWSRWAALRRDCFAAVRVLIFMIEPPG
jgi:hypothetical protein